MLAELLATEKIFLSPRQLDQLEWLADELLRWNRRRNLTAITDYAAVLEKHLLDSLTLLPLVCAGQELLDIGSGPGFPALPLKVACPKLAVTTIEAVAKKVSFQRHVIRSLELQDMTALHGRAEDLADDQDYRGRFDLVTARALAALPRLMQVAIPLLAPGGRVIAMKGPDVNRELADCAESMKTAGWSVEQVRRTLPSTGAERRLIIIRPGTEDPIHKI